MNIQQYTKGWTMKSNKIKVSIRINKWAKLWHL